MESLKEVLIHRDEISEKEAEEQISEMRERVLGGEDAEEILREIGLEPDYVFDLITF